MAGTGTNRSNASALVEGEEWLHVEWFIAVDDMHDKGDVAGGLGGKLEALGYRWDSETVQ